MKHGRFCTLSDKTVWPCKDISKCDDDSVEWKLRYYPLVLQRGDQLYAASIIAAYNALIDMPLKNALDKLRMLKKEMRSK